MKHLFIFISIFLLKSCGSAQNTSKASNNDNMATAQSLSGDYEIKILTDYYLETPCSISFDEAKESVSGFSGCNRFFGSYKTKGNTISFSQIGSTKKLCKPELNQIEKEFLYTLNSVNTFQFTDKGLLLLNDDDLLLNATPKMERRASEDIEMNLTYRASTRGFFETIWIEGQTLKFTKDRNLKDIQRFKLSKEQLSELHSLYKAIDLELLPSLEPPSKTFQYDAAAFATLEIIEGENTYKTSGFDHGNPPKPIALFVEKLLSIKEAMVKQ